MAHLQTVGEGSGRLLHRSDFDLDLHARIEQPG